MKLISSLALLLSTLLYASAQQVTHNIPYTHLGDSPKADLYQPTGAGPFPAIVYIHGGSWRSGSKDVYKTLATDLAAQGYAGLSIDYDLKPHSFPTSWLQSRDAVRFLRTHAAEYHLDPNRIAVAGDSAGGELAALLALAPEGPAAGTDATSVPVAAALIFNGVYRLCGTAHVINRYLGDHALCTDASPMNHVHPGPTPFYIGHGTADSTVPFAEAQAFISALRAQGVSVTAYNAEDGPHSYWREKKFYAANLAAAQAFLKAKLPPS